MRDMAKFLYTHNPFYLVSAGFVLYGLHLAFKTTNTPSDNAYYLMSSLCGYTSLLALTAWSVVRFGKVWDDARTLALLVVLMFLAISSSFDEACYLHPKLGGIVLASGWLFCIFTSEVLLRFLPVKLPWQYRLPYHLGLALFFAFPSLLMSRWIEQSGWTIEARVGSFASIAAVITMLLIPAAAYGPRLVQGNGSPWPWPWYPWAIFIFMAIGVMARSYMLTISFQSDVGWTSTFGPHYLIPFCLAILVLLVELSFSHTTPRLRVAVLLLPFVLLSLSVRFDGNESYMALFDAFTNRFGSPLWLTLASLLVFYTYVWFRGERRAEWPLMFLIAISSLIRIDTTVISNLQLHSNWLFAVIAGIQIIGLFRAGRSLRLMIVGTCLSVIAFHARHSPSLVFKDLLLPIHIILISVGLCGVLFKDAFALFVRTWMPSVLVALVTATCLLSHSNRLSPPLLLSYSYSVGWTLASLLIWYMNRDKVWRLVSFACSASLFCSASVHLVQYLERWISKEAMISILIGAVCFSAGALVSAIKGGFKLPSLRLSPSQIKPIGDGMSEDPDGPK